MDQFLTGLTFFFYNSADAKSTPSYFLGLTYLGPPKQAWDEGITDVLKLVSQSSKIPKKVEISIYVTESPCEMPDKCNIF